mmetsp:Transcript_11005/g.40985  ORF Transcript_11005/g.40985 Transcript_11005/m.40985 type:complete len:271 (+) Transcript_11005:3990-4802(+)
MRFNVFGFVLEFGNFCAHVFVLQLKLVHSSLNGRKVLPSSVGEHLWQNVENTVISRDSLQFLISETLVPHLVCEFVQSRFNLIKGFLRNCNLPSLGKTLHSSSLVDHRPKIIFTSCGRIYSHQRFTNSDSNTHSKTSEHDPPKIILENATFVQFQKLPRPFCLVKLHLNGQGTLNSIKHTWCGNHKGITLRFALKCIIFLDEIANDLVVKHESLFHSFWISFPSRGAPLDICKHESNTSSRSLLLTDDCFLRTVFIEAQSMIERFDLHLM